MQGYGAKNPYKMCCGDLMTNKFFWDKKIMFVIAFSFPHIADW